MCHENLSSRFELQLVDRKTKFFFLILFYRPFPALHYLGDSHRHRDDRHDRRRSYDKDRDRNRGRDERRRDSRHEGRYEDEKRRHFTESESRSRKKSDESKEPNTSSSKPFSFQLKPKTEETKQQTSTSKSFTIQLDTNKVKTQNDLPVLQKPKGNVASVFNNDSESEEEEMPLEARMKMRNVGRDTITSSGPNSFGKGKEGFTKNSFKNFELSMKPRNSFEKQIDYQKD